MRPDVTADHWQAWRTVLTWTVLGPLGCMTAALACHAALFYDLPPRAFERAMASAIILPLVLGIPLFLLFALKLRDLAAANRKLGITAAADGLTDCLNRAAFTTLVETRLKHLPSAAGPSYGALLIVDADNVKAINGTFGRHAGDTALKLIAHAIRTAVRRADPVGRLGAGQFAVFLPGVDREVAAAVADRIRAAVEAITFIPNGQRHRLSISIGGVAFSAGARFEDLFREADIQLYVARQSGRNRVMLASYDRDLALA